MREPPEPWKSRAKCLGLDPNLFVPETRGGSLKRIYAICNGSPVDQPCPVRAECENFAIREGLVGVFGGRMHSQRMHREPVVVVELRIRDGRPKSGDDHRAM